MENKKIEEMETEELKELKLKIEAELNKRKEDKKIIYNTDNFNSSTYHINKYKPWAKEINAIDITKTNGFAFIGNFLKLKNENIVKQGQHVVEMDENRLYLYKAKEDYKKDLILEESKANYISFIRNVAEIIKKEGEENGKV